MDDPERSQLAIDLMMRFAERTGLSSPERPPRRYLWTDAFAVCNLLGLARSRDAQRLRDLAVRLVGQVHHVLGRHRSDDRRTGWLSGLDDAAGEEHPTRGGLRIGKQLLERRAGDPVDPQLEWDRDGQYFHYLTKWMHALDQLALHTGDERANRWARELAETAHAAFVHTPAPGAPRRMIWKMSIDLSRPQVASMGQHDPLDGLVTCLQLRAHRDRSPGGPELTAETSDFAAIASTGDWGTDDPLGIGGLLFDAYRVEQLGRDWAQARPLLSPIVDAAASGLRAWLRTRPLDRSAAHRLAFREIGLSIGLRAADRLCSAAREERAGWIDRGTRTRLDELRQSIALADAIESFWSSEEHQRADTWLEHLDINAVMLATSLQPDGFLELG